MLVTYAISCQASKGTVQLLNVSTGEISYTPAPNANGADSFFAVATDNGGKQSSVREYKINIEPVPDLPSAANMIFDVWVENTPAERMLPYTHPDGLDKITNVYVPPVKGILRLSNSTTSADGIQRGLNPFTYVVDQAGGGSPSAPTIHTTTTTFINPRLLVCFIVHHQ